MSKILLKLMLISCDTAHAMFYTARAMFFLVGVVIATTKASSIALQAERKWDVFSLHMLTSE